LVQAGVHNGKSLCWRNKLRLEKARTDGFRKRSEKVGGDEQGEETGRGEVLHPV
jgi:hypothetical protein